MPDRFFGVREQLRKIAIRFRCATMDGKLRYLREQGCIIGEGTRLHCGASAFGTEPYLIEIGKDCVISDDVRFFTHDGGINVLNSLGRFGNRRMDKMGRVKVGNNVYIGTGAYIMPGVRIGDNCIIGAGSIVTKDVPDNACAAGVPARLMGSIDQYYARAIGRVYETRDMSGEEKKRYLIEHVKPAGVQDENAKGRE